MELKDLVKIKKIKEIEFTKWDHDFNVDALQDNHNKLGGGIYRMYDKEANIIYVGKSNNIHRRLLQHIGKRTNSAYFIDQAVRIEYFVENNPIFQTMLEGIFIAYHSPKFNDEVQDALQTKEWENSLNEPL